MKLTIKCYSGGKLIRTFKDISDDNWGVSDIGLYINDKDGDTLFKWTGDYSVDYKY